jgi:hypothetical protein
VYGAIVRDYGRSVDSEDQQMLNPPDFYGIAKFVRLVRPRVNGGL